MTLKTWLLLIVALVCGVAAAFCVKSIFFVDGGAQTAVDPSADAGPKERILIANVDLPSGTELTAQNVRLNLVPESSIPRDALFSFDGLAGRKTLRDIKVDSAISLYDLELEEETAAHEKPFVPPGHSVVPIEIQTASNVKGGRNLLKTTPLDQMIKVGDFVDLAVVKEDSSASLGDALAPKRPRLTTKRIVEEVAVFGVSDEKRFAAESAGATRVSIVSVLLSAEQLETVRKASEEGKIKVLAAGEGDDVETFDENDSLNLTSIFSNEKAVSQADSNADFVVETAENAAETVIENGGKENAAEAELEIPMNADFELPGLAAAEDEDEANGAKDGDLIQANLKPTAAQKSTDDQNDDANLDVNFSSNEMSRLPDLASPENTSASFAEQDVLPTKSVEKGVASSSENERVGSFRVRRPNAPVVAAVDEALVPAPNPTLKVLSLRERDDKTTSKTLKTVGDVRWRTVDENTGTNAAEKSSESSLKKNESAAGSGSTAINRSRRG